MINGTRFAAVISATVLLLASVELDQRNYLSCLRKLRIYGIAVNRAQSIYDVGIVDLLLVQISLRSGGNKHI